MYLSLMFGVFRLPETKINKILFPNEDNNYHKLWSRYDNFNRAEPCFKMYRRELEERRPCKSSD